MTSTGIVYQLNHTSIPVACQFTMGKLLSLLARDENSCCSAQQKYDIFLDFESMYIKVFKYNTINFNHRSYNIIFNVMHNKLITNTLFSLYISTIKVYIICMQLNNQQI